MEEGYIKLGDLKVYRLAVDVSDCAWGIYGSFDWHTNKIIGDQFITAVDSVAANIAEGYGRFHYLDRIKFYYNARASLLEAKHWAFMLQRREKITKERFQEFIAKAENLHLQLNIYIKSCYQTKTGS